MSGGTRHETGRKLKPNEARENNNLMPSKPHLSAGLKMVPRAKAQSLPSATDLAIIAAILAPHEPAQSAIQQAMAFYVEALFTLQDLPRDSEGLIRQFASEYRQLRAQSRLRLDAAKKQWGDTLELIPHKNGADVDEARKFLSHLGLTLKQARSVLKNLKAFCQPELMETFERRDTGKMIYAIPRHLLEQVVMNNKERQKEAKRKGWNTRRDTESEGASHRREANDNGAKTRQQKSSV